MPRLKFTALILALRLPHWPGHKYCEPGQWLVAWAVCATFAAAQEPDKKVNSVVIEREGDDQQLGLRTEREPIVQVEGENHRPVAGATVIFTVPTRSAGGRVADGGQTLITRTDNVGRAVARGLHPNKIQGQFQIHVNASFQDQTAALTIAQTNTVIAGALCAIAASISAKHYFALAGTVATGGAVAATRSGGNSNGNNSQPPVPGASIGLGAGGVSVGTPH